jgi:hypothetical protein
MATCVTLNKKNINIKTKNKKLQITNFAFISKIYSNFVLAIKKKKLLIACKETPDFYRPRVWRKSLFGKHCTHFLYLDSTYCLRKAKHLKYFKEKKKKKKASQRIPKLSCNLKSSFQISKHFNLLQFIPSVSCWMLK